MLQALSQPKTIHYVHARLVYEQEILPGDLWVVDGKIASPQKKADRVVDVQNQLLAPGFIDLQVNGAFGFDFALDLTHVAQVAEGLKVYGVTSFLPTVISSPLNNYTTLLNSLSNHPAVLGIHLEGPFLNPQKSGAHSLGNQEEGGFFFEKEILKKVRMVTLAPEMPRGQDLILHLRKAGIVVSAGHTEASYEEALAAFQNGVSCVTHLFNAMTPIHQRAPGIVAAALTEPTIYYSLIVDGIHVHPALVKLAWQAHSKGMIVVSDAISALGMGIGEYTLGKQKVHVREGRATLGDSKTLAGSVVPLDQAVRNLYRFTGCSIPQAVATVTAHPAALLGLGQKKGTLQAGADADLVLLDDQLNVKECFSFYASSSSSTSS